MESSRRWWFAGLGARPLLWLLAAALSGAVGAQPADAPVLDGVWVGSAMQNGRPSSVRLVVGGRTMPADEVTVRFGSPRNCGIVARRSGAAQKAYRYEVTDSSGGVFCDALYPGTLTLSPGEGADLTLEAEGGQRKSTVLLWRAGTPSPTGVADPRALLGTWTGTLPLRSGTLGVALAIVGVEPGDGDNTLRYEGMRRCSLMLAYEGSAAEDHYFSARASSTAGGYCDRMVGRYLLVRVEGGHIRYRFDPDDGDCKDGCTLTAAVEGR